MAKLSPVFNDQTIDANGDPYVGAKLFTYTAGSSTKQAVYTDAAGTIPHSNPIILDSLGFPTQGAIWIPEGISVKFVLTSPTDTDPPTSPIKTIDNVQGINDSSVAISEWQSSGVTPTYISATSFSLPGDQTSAFHKGRRAQFTTSGGTVYGKIINSVFTSLTTVTMLMDGASVLDSGLSVANLSLLRADVPALPNPIELLRSSVVGNATLTPTWDRAYGEIQDVSGVVTYTAIPAAPQPGATRIWYPAAGAIMTHGGSITVQGNLSATAAAGDAWVITAVTTSTFYVELRPKTGAPALGSFSTSAENIAGTIEGKPVDPLGIREAFNASGTAPVYACRAWVNFNGTGSISIRGSGNVTSLTDVGTGYYRVNFLVGMQDANYAANITCAGNNPNGSTLYSANAGQPQITPTTSYVEFAWFGADDVGARVDTAYNMVTVFR